MSSTALPPGGLGIIRRLLGDQGRLHWTRYVVAFACMALVA
ncbi:MAG: hypothetical protein JWL93_1274, partial [Hyphomicrobiales bacterium]|nr:hypothetical protein [Hyphomicrobiales bacterium]